MDKSALYEKAAQLYKSALAEGADADEARAAYDAAIARIASMPETKASAPTPASATKAPLSASENLVGGVRAAGQGLTFGFGDEAEGAVRAALDPNLDYKTARDQVRGEQSRFAEEHPVINTGLEIGGALATGGAVRGLAKGGASLLARGATALSNSALAQGAIAGAGASDSETLGGVAADAGIGGALGGTLGVIGGKVGGKAAEIMQRARGTETARALGRAGDQLQSTIVPVLGQGSGAGQMMDKALLGVGKLMSDIPEGERAGTLAGRRAVTALAHRMGQGKVTPDVLDVAGGANTAKDARILDNAGVAGERVARSLRTVGGEAGEMIDNFATTRQRTQVERMTDALYNGKSIDDVVGMVDDFVKERKLQSTPLYEQFRAQPAVHVQKVEDLLKRPLFQRAVAAAEEYQRNAGIAPSVVSLPGGGTHKLRTPDFLDNVKKSLDDIIYKGKQPGEGGMGPGALRQAKELREEFVAEVDKVVPYYKAARDAWAGPTALKGAMEDGIEAAKSAVTPEALRKEFSSLSSSEQELFQRGYLDQLRQRLENGGLKPAATEQRAFLKRIDAVFGQDANLILTRLRDEVAATRTANFLSTGSQTMDKNAEVIDALAPESSNAWQQAFFNPRRSVANLAGRYASSRLAAPLGKETRKEVAKLLLSPQDEEAVVRMLAGEYAAQDAGRTVSNRVRGPLAAETSFGFFRRPPEEKK